MLYYVYKIKNEGENMKNQYIPKKFKLAMILNAMYQRNSTCIPYTFAETFERVGKVLMPNLNVTHFNRLWTGYRRTECHILNINDDWDISLSYIVDYANKHNVKLYSREYLRL